MFHILKKTKRKFCKNSSPGFTTVYVNLEAKQVRVLLLILISIVNGLRTPGIPVRNTSYQSIYHLFIAFSFSFFSAAASTQLFLPPLSVLTFSSH